MTAVTTRVLLVDDDARLFELLARYLGPHDVALDHAPDGGRGLALFEAGAYDAVLLDVMMPGMDGLEVLRRLRQKSGVPVLMLTARGDEADRVVGLELGADDYVAKPFGPRELLARLRAVLRRTQTREPNERLSAGGVVVDVASRRVTVEGREVYLTALEYDLLVTLLRRAGRVIPRASLLPLAGREEVVGERTVDVHVSKLRKKLGDDPRQPKLLQTVRGVGYVFAANLPEEPA
jgi:DNA-binding response OmpR family regulator